jgi:alkylation response protein AidB-like acyl-CoA dehydrogenase
MPTYRAPIADFRFLLSELLDVHALAQLPPYADAAPDVLLAVLEEGGKFCSEVLAPLNLPADAQGSRYADGTVTTPDGFKEAFRAWGDGGWIGLSHAPEHGGQGLPLVMRIAIDEMACAANLSFAMFGGLTNGVYDGIHQHGSDELKQLYLPKLASGTWAGTMCLTEAHAGTDLGIMHSKAVPAGDGTYRVTGTKIFITSGEHDLTENIVHLVLAKLPDAPEGTRGISMFLVPKFIPNADGSLGARNTMRCDSIEHKMGIKASPTCVLRFESATGWLVGEPHRGLRAMFTLMNGARLGVGIQGLGLADVSYQNAEAYARERLQGRSLSGVKSPNSPADPIIVHADIRRGLLTMRAFVESARALALWTAMRLDEEHAHPDDSKRREAADLVALMTPVIKAIFTDLGFESTNIGLQTLGGHGYIREFGMEQFVRDARIGQIYEGTNHIQALDLLGRKLPEGNGRLYGRYAAILTNDLAAGQADPRVAPMATALGDAFQRLQHAIHGLTERVQQNPDELGAAANEFLHLFGYVALGHMWLRMAQVAHAKLAAGGENPPAFYTAKIDTARFYFAKMLPRTRALAASIEAGGESVLCFEW